MGFKGYIGQGLDIIKLDRDAAEAVSRDENAFGTAVLFFAIGGLAASIGGSMLSMGLGTPMLLFSPIVHVIASFVWVGILYLLARIFGGTGGYRGYYSALGIGSLSMWAQAVPFLGFIVALWNIPVTVVVTERVHNLSTAKAIFVVLLPFFALFFLFVAAVAIIGVAALMSFANMGRMPGM